MDSIYTRYLPEDRECVVVKKVKYNIYEVIIGSIGCLKQGTMIKEFKGKVVDDEGNELKASGQYFMTTETIDPYHLLVDLF